MHLLWINELQFFSADLLDAEGHTDMQMDRREVSRTRLWTDGPSYRESSEKSPLKKMYHL